MLPSRSGILAEAINTKILAKNHTDSPHSHSDSPPTHPDSPPSHYDSPRSYHSPHSFPRFPIPAFTDNHL